MSKLQFATFILILVITLIKIDLCDGSASCDQCISSLVEFLEQVNQDISYANKTIEKSRANAKFGLKLEQLESAYSEHSIGLEKSEALYQQAIRAINKFTANETANSTDESVNKILDELEDKVEQFGVPNKLPSMYLKNHDDVHQLNRIVERFESSLAIHRQKINASMEQLERIDKNFLEQTHSDSKMVELGGGMIKKMVRESRALIRAQENSCDRLDTTLDELNLWLKQVNLHIKHIKSAQNNSDIYTNIISTALNLSQPLRIEDLEDIGQSLEGSIVLAKSMAVNFLKLNQSLRSGDPNEESEIFALISRLYSHLNFADLKARRIMKNLGTGSIQLLEFSRFQNGGETVDMFAKLASIKTNLAGLDKRISDKWLELKPKLTRYNLDDNFKTVIEGYENLTQSDGWQGFSELNDSIGVITFAVNSMIETQTKIDQLANRTTKNLSQSRASILEETRRIKEIVFSSLLFNVTSTERSIVKAETELTNIRSVIAKLNESITIDLRRIRSWPVVEEMKNLTTKANSSSANVHELVGMTQKMIDEFSSLTRGFSLLHKGSRHRTKVDGVEEVLEYLDKSSENSSYKNNKTFDKPQIFTLADGLLDSLNETLGVKVNKSQASELTRLFGTEMQQISMELRNKVHHARSLINQFYQVPDYGRMVSFPKPKSNISSSFVQSLNLNHDLDELMLEQSTSDENNLGSYNLTNGHIRRLTIKFKSLQQNGLLVHHSRPDHSSFMSIYITGGRLMLALNFDKKIRIESHISLSDGQWHTLYLIVSRRMSHHHHQQQHNQDGMQKSGGGCSRVKHTVCAILDDSFTYRSRSSVCFEPISSPSKVSGLTKHREPTKRSVDMAKDATLSVTPASQPPSMMANFTERLLNHADDNSNWEEQSKKVLYFGGVEDKYIPLLRNQQIPTNFHGCIANVTINNIKLNFLQAKKNQALLVNHCPPD